MHVALTQLLFLDILEILLWHGTLIMIKVYTVSNEQNFYDFIYLFIYWCLHLRHY